jgi:glutamate synthase domain-containing protein 2/glutamate synthase domain-containing protein 1/glutamate synthase domain-containing protein 3
MKKVASRQIVVDANEMLVRMSHRGGCGCEENSGDGAGILVGLPDDYYRKVMKNEFGWDKAESKFGTGILFVPPDDASVAALKDIMDNQVARKGLSVIGWKTVETDNSALGASSLSTEPRMEQVFIENSQGLSSTEFDRELFKIRKVCEVELERENLVDGEVYFSSLSSQTVTYKGQLTPEQVYDYFQDLKSPDFTTHMALVHSRFATNTFPSWARAQPVRMMCHNGEINTLRGNKNWMYSRGSLLSSSIFGSAQADILLRSTSDNMSDSGNFDAVLDVLSKGSDRSLPECMMMMIPEAWQDNDSLTDSKRAFYEYNSNLMEPWDGPAMIAFTDGKYIGATLDRNGLRPSRYYVTHDDRILLSSEVGVVPDLPDADVRIKARLEPGKMFLVDFDEGAIVSDDIIKEAVATRYPYGDWLEQRQFSLDEVASLSPVGFNFDETVSRLNSFGYTHETLDMLLYPMAVGNKEALGSMGNDAALAVMSQQPRLVFDYFKQLFAQVTNPPIDPIREEMVMSLRCPVGPEQNLMEIGPDHCERMVFDHPILTLQEMNGLKDLQKNGWKSKIIDMTFPKSAGVNGLVEKIEEICEEASAAVQGKLGEDGCQVVILSDRMVAHDRMAVPSLMAVGAVHQHLIKTRQRPKAALVAEVGDSREVHDFALLLGYGLDGVCPYMAYEALALMNKNGVVEARSGETWADEDLWFRYRQAAAKGILKVMSKMGISTLQSYKGAQVFEAIGLDDEIMDRCFPGTFSRVRGADFTALFNDLKAFHDNSQTLEDLFNPGNFHYRNNGESHLNTPEGMVSLQQAARGNSKEMYKAYTAHTDKQNQSVTLRGVLKFKEEGLKSIPLEQVESAASIVKRFNTGAMSLGSISQETHETLAQAMNQLGARSNTGEGGEDPARFLDNRRSAIKQVASGRFGVTSHYLANSDQIQIKMAQGAKPGEGGELPGFKVTPYIAASRMTTPGVGLISPPPHHDIYSIEDLAQLIHDLKNAQPSGEVSVKLVSEVGVGVVAAGVAKAKADHITVSGGDGGTGAAAWTGVKGCGLPWELGLAETQQTLVVNGLRDRIKLQTDGQLKTGRDVVIATMLGAEEFGFATAPLIALGCIMMRKCHLNTCPVGIATQDEELRKKFSGKPEHVINFFFLMAEEIREYMAQLGVASMDELVGRADLLEVNHSVLHEKNKGLDLMSLLVTATDLNPGVGTRHAMLQDHQLDAALDNELIAQARPALEDGVPVSINSKVTNLNRTVGTMLSHEISKKFGAKGLPDDTIQINLDGHGGQSLGFTLAKGITMRVVGDSNDGTGKGLSGGKLSVRPHEDVIAAGFEPENNVIIGNVALYGATSGSAFFRGVAGERFAVRNSGALAVVEGVGDHGCEYMTGGRVVVLGETGRNFGAGMSGGVAFIYDPYQRFADRCNMGMVGLEPVESQEDKTELRRFLEAHVAETASSRASQILGAWEAEVPHFVKVMPHDYKRVLDEAKAMGSGVEDDAAAA